MPKYNIFDIFKIFDILEFRGGNMIADILEHLYSERKDYKGLSEMIRLLNNNEEFRKLIIEGIKENKINGFSEELWEMIKNQRIRASINFTDVFREGLNIDRCTVAAKQLSYSFNTCYIAGGTLSYLIDSPFAKAKDGRHTWIIHERKIYDTTLMLVIDEDYVPKLGYILENKCNPNLSPTYLAAKEFTNDMSIKMPSK